jgi:hypothetical protein
MLIVFTYSEKSMKQYKEKIDLVKLEKTEVPEHLVEKVKLTYSCTGCVKTKSGI